MVKRRSPDDPVEWLNRARSDLALAGVKRQGIYLEDLCFHAQQAVEKAVKALLIKHDVEFPYVHDIANLMTLLEEAGLEIPEPVKQSERLTRFAVFARYPGIAPEVSRGEYRDALKMAKTVVDWAERELHKTPGKR